MAHSEEREGLFGDKYTAHYDDAGNKTGESRTRERLFGGEYVETTDAGGRKVSESTPREALFGDSYRETRDTSGRLISTSRDRESLFGDKYVETRDASGEKIAESRRRVGLFGNEYVETTRKKIDASRADDDVSPSSSGDSSDAWVSLVVGLFLFVLAVMFFFINILGWIGSIAGAVTVAYFYALVRWREIKKQPEAGALIEEKNRKRGAPRFEVARSFADKQIRWFPERLLIGGVSLLVGAAYAYSVARLTSDVWILVLVGVGPLIGVAAGVLAGTAVLRWRLNELVLREEKLKATHYTWPSLAALIPSLPALLIVAANVGSSLLNSDPIIVTSGSGQRSATPTATAAASSPVRTSTATGAAAGVTRASPTPGFALARPAVTPAAITPRADTVSAAELDSRVLQFIDEHWMRQNGSAFSRIRLTSDSDAVYFEARDLNYSVRPQPLTDEDRRAGKEWQGDLVFAASATRSYSRNGTTVHWEEHPAGWSEWGSTPYMELGVRATKRHGSWEYTWPTFVRGETQKPLAKPSAGEIRTILEHRTSALAKSASSSAGVSTAGVSSTPGDPRPLVAATAAPPSRTFTGEVFPRTRIQYLTAADVQTMSAAEAQFAINEIFARHGAEFGPRHRDLTKWFSQFDWYSPRAGVDFDTLEAEMTAIERENIKFLGAVRDQRSTVRGQAQRTPAQQPQRQPERKGPRNAVGERFLEAILRGIADGLDRR